MCWHVKHFHFCVSILYVTLSNLLLKLEYNQTLFIRSSQILYLKSLLCFRDIRKRVSNFSGDHNRPAFIYIAFTFFNRLFTSLFGVYESFILYEILNSALVKSEHYIKTVAFLLYLRHAVDIIERNNNKTHFTRIVFAVKSILIYFKLHIKIFFL